MKDLQMQLRSIRSIDYAFALPLSTPWLTQPTHPTPRRTALRQDGTILSSLPKTLPKPPTAEGPSSSAHTHSPNPVTPKFGPPRPSPLYPPAPADPPAPLPNDVSMYGTVTSATTPQPGRYMRPLREEDAEPNVGLPPIQEVPPSPGGGMGDSMVVDGVGAGVGDTRGLWEGDARGWG